MNWQDLILLWSGNFKEVTGPWVLPKKTWEAIDEEILEAYKQIPSSHGRRMPKPFAHLAWFTAEDYSAFLLRVGAVVLYDRLPLVYYRHFLALSSIGRRLLDFRIPRASVAVGGELREDIIAWVEAYERSVSLPFVL